MVCIGHYIYLYVVATDDEDSEEELQLIIEYDDGDGIWKTDYIDNNTIWDPQGWLKVKFQPAWWAKEGDYYFRAKARDTDGNISFNYVYLNEPIEVNNIRGTILEDISLSATEIYRGDTLYIFLNASDIIDRECDLTVIVEYNRNNTGWVDVPESWISYDDTNFNPNDDEGYWVIAFTTDKSTRLGEYQFRGTVRNSEDDPNNNGFPTYPNPDTAEIMNNLPVALELEAEDSSVERRGSITLTAKGKDYEDDPDEIEPFFEWRVRNGTWQTSGFSNKQPPQSPGGSWCIAFSPRDDAELGSYDIRVYFEDRDEDKSDYLTEQGLIEVTNALPEVTSLVLLKNEGYRLEELLISADGTDIEDIESDLEPIFEYRGPFGDWVGAWERGNYFQNPSVYINGHWRIIFNPPVNAIPGEYSYRVQLIDNEGGESEWAYLNNSYALMNNEPEVEIVTYPGTYETKTIEFSAIGVDLEGDLTWEWDFGDGETSNEQTPIHSYNRGETYSVTVTVTDNDGAIAVDSITLYIQDVDDPTILNEPLRLYFLIVFIVFAIITATISIKIFSSLKKRENNKDQKE
jgi:hypothetical protein